jgi:D-alanine-D-alanine ligase
MPERETVLVLMGGPDAERAVSIMSGSQVAAALRASGRFDVADRLIEQPALDDLRAMATDAAADVVFPVLHGRWGEGGPLQKLLDALGLPYVGSRPRAASLAMDKLVTKALLADHVPTPRARQLLPADACDLPPPLVLKPVDDGSSVDLRICATADEVDRARRELHPKRGRLMAEEYIRGREITAGILIGEALPLIEIIPPPDAPFYDYEAKYTRDDTRYVIDPPLPAGVAAQCAEIALSAFERLGCRDVARVDLMIDARGPWFLEINTMPGFTTHSLVPMAARARGLEMPALTARLVEAALDRAGAAARPSPRAARAATAATTPAQYGNP